MPPLTTAEPSLYYPSTRIKVGLSATETHWYSSPSYCSPPRLWDAGPGPPPPLADGLRGQDTLDRPWPNCGWESVPSAARLLFPLPEAAAELQGRRPKAAGALGTPPLLSRGERGKKKGHLAQNPLPFP